MKTTEKLDHLENEHDLFKPLSGKQMEDTFGADFAQKLIPMESNISYELVFEEENKLYRTIFRVVNFRNDTYNMTRQNNKLYKELDDSQIQHYLYLMERYEYALRHYRKIVEHPTYRLRTLFLEDHPLEKIYPLRGRIPHGH